MNSQPALAKVMSRQMENAASGELSDTALLKWHLDVMKARGTEPWILELGESSPLQLTEVRADPDFRLTNLRTLLQETQWAG